MAIQKHMLPILEYDEDPGAILMPNREEGYRFPEKAVFAFLGGLFLSGAAWKRCGGSVSGFSDQLRGAEGDLCGQLRSIGTSGRKCVSDSR